MNDDAARVRHYEASLDRAGLALGAGSVLAGAVGLGLMLAGGARDPLALAIGTLIGCVFAAVAITAVAAPLWLMLHVAGLRRARHAAMLGAGTTLVLFAGAQTYGFGLLAMPVMDDRTWLFRLLSAIATSLLLAGVAALIGAAMWRIAYRLED